MSQHCPDNASTELFHHQIGDTQHYPTDAGSRRYYQHHSDDISIIQVIDTCHQDDASTPRRHVRDVINTTKTVQAHPRCCLPYADGTSTTQVMHTPP
jgi:hypothetical protein